MNSKQDSNMPGAFDMERTHVDNNFIPSAPGTSATNEDDEMDSEFLNNASNWTIHSKFFNVPKLKICMKRAEPHFMRKNGKIANISHLRDHAKWWKRGQGDDWKIRRNNCKHVFSYNVKKKLKKAIEIINKKFIKSKKIDANLNFKDDETTAALDQTKITLRELGKLEIDLGCSDAVLLARDLNNRQIIPTIEDGVPVRFLTYSEKKDKSLLHLHFDTESLQSRTQGLGSKKWLDSFSEPSTNSPSPEQNDMQMDMIVPDLSE